MNSEIEKLFRKDSLTFLNELLERDPGVVGIIKWVYLCKWLLRCDIHSSWRSEHHATSLFLDAE